MHRYTILQRTFFIHFYSEYIFNYLSSICTIRSKGISLSRKRILTNIPYTIVSESETCSRLKQISSRVSLGDTRFNSIIKVHSYINGIRRNDIPILVFCYEISIVYSFNLIINLLLNNNTTVFGVEHSKVIIQIGNSSQTSSSKNLFRNQGLEFFLRLSVPTTRCIGYRNQKSGNSLISIFR